MVSIKTSRTLQQDSKPKLKRALTAALWVIAYRRRK